MAKYLSQKEVIEKMSNGYRLYDKRNYKNIIVSYWISHKDNRTELPITIKTRNLLFEKGLIDSNDCLVLSKKQSNT